MDSEVHLDFNATAYDDAAEDEDHGEDEELFVRPRLRVFKHCIVWHFSYLDFFCLHPKRHDFDLRAV